MFEFVEKVATDIITSLGNTISQMSFDASSYDAQATENDAKAAYFANKTLRKVHKKIGLTGLIR